MLTKALAVQLDSKGLYCFLAINERIYGPHVEMYILVDILNTETFA